MSASLSYPVSAFKSSSKARSQILILEPDIAVLDYLRLTLGDQYALSLFSEEQSLLDRLDQRGARPAAAGTPCEPGPNPAVDPHPLLKAESSRRCTFVFGGVAGSGDGDPARGARDCDEAVYRQRRRTGDRRTPGNGGEEGLAC